MRCRKTARRDQWRCCGAACWPLPHLPEAARHRSLRFTTLPHLKSCPFSGLSALRIGPFRPLTARFSTPAYTACFQSLRLASFGPKKHYAQAQGQDDRHRWWGRGACRHAAPAAGRLGFAREPASALSWWLGGSQRGERTAYSLCHQSSALRQASHRPGAPSQDTQLDHVPALHGSLISRRIAVAARRSVAAAKLFANPQAHCQIS